MKSKIMSYVIALTLATSAEQAFSVELKAIVKSGEDIDVTMESCKSAKKLMKYYAEERILNFKELKANYEGLCGNVRPATNIQQTYNPTENNARHDHGGKKGQVNSTNNSESKCCHPNRPCVESKNDVTRMNYFPEKHRICFNNRMWQCTSGNWVGYSACDMYQGLDNLD